jgi:hypothetical protein
MRREDNKRIEVLTLFIQTHINSIWYLDYIQMQNGPTARHKTDVGSIYFFLF